MGETLNHISIGEGFDLFTPDKKNNADGSTFVGDEKGGTVLKSARFTVLEIIDRPSDEAKAAQLANTIWDRINGETQTLIDGKLVSEDNPRLASRFDPSKLYIVEQ